MKKVLFGMIALFVSLNALAENPTISGVMVQQRWPWSRSVDIDYMLKCDAGKSYDINVVLYNGDVRLDVPEASLSGDRFGVKRGARRIVWDPTTINYTSGSVIPELRVELTPILAPLYMIVDLTKSAGAPEQITYVFEEALTNDTYGTWVRNPVTNGTEVIESVIWTGVTNDLYKTERLVFRRVPRDGFDFGEAGLSTTFSQGLYAGVFEITQRQYELITGETPSYYVNAAYNADRPVEQVSYEEIRGSKDGTPAVNWPVTDRSGVASDSFIGQLRAKTGLNDIDLPTEAQWEFLCRAETDTFYNDGEIDAPDDGVSLDNTVSNLFIEALGRCRYNGGYTGTGSPTGTDHVGSYRPNAWGLYDTHGNVHEFCLDWSGGTLVGGIDPRGPMSGTFRIIRGGAWNGQAEGLSSRSRSRYNPTAKGSSVGFRVVRTLL